MPSSGVYDFYPGSASSSVSGPFLMGLQRTGDDRQNALMDATLECFRAHTRLVRLGVSTVDRLRSALVEIVFDLPGDLPGHFGDLLRQLVARLQQWSRVMSRDPKIEAELEALREERRGDMPPNWNCPAWARDRVEEIRNDLLWKYARERRHVETEINRLLGLR